MTISSTVRIAGPFTGNGVNATFPFTYKVFDAVDVQVVRLTISTGVETTLTIVTDYNITLNGDQDSNPGGNIVLVAALSALYKLTATSDIANLQPTDLTNQGGFYPEVITDALDRATIQIQQMSDDVDRSLKVPISDGLLNMELPSTSIRMNKIFAFDGNGIPMVVAQSPSSISGNTTIMGTLTVTGATSIESLTVGNGSGDIATNTAFGLNALQENTTGNRNTAIGNTALPVNTTGQQNTAIGALALNLNITGNGNTAVGDGALQRNKNSSNSAFGVGALGYNTDGNYNTACGMSSLSLNTTGVYNTAVGYQALLSNTIGADNTAVGVASLRNNVSGSYNSCVGQNALSSNTTGVSNSAVGLNASQANTTGNQNVSFGHNSLQTNTTGNDNVAIGFQSLLTNLVGSNQTAIGKDALKLATGANNTAIGNSAGSTLTTGSANVFVGYNATPSGVGVSNEVNIYNGSIVARFQGAAAAWSFVSDARDKENIENLNFGLDFINQLQPRKFNWNIRNSDVDKGKEAAGFIAQELASVVESQSADCLGLVYTNDPNQFSIAQTNLIPVLVNAIKELNAKFEAYVATHP